jgi:hypothetical protein
MKPNQKAIKYYKRWTRTKFSSARFYIIMNLVIVIATFGTCWIESQQTGESFDWGVWKGALTLVLIGSFITFVLRWTGVSTSWIIAKQALDLINLGQKERAWALLADRYINIHPLVINKPAFREILAAAAQSQDDPLAQELVAYCKDGASQGANEYTKHKARKAVIFVVTCIALLIVVEIIRFLFR